MITIHQSAVESANTHTGIVVATAEDYTEARRAIRQALASNRELDIYVVERTYDDWFWDYEGVSDIRFSNEDPIERLRNKLGGRPLPDYLSAEDIVSLRLLEALDPEEPVRDVGEWVAEVTLGKDWSEMSPSVEHLAALATWWADREISPLEPAARSIAFRRLLHWSSIADGELQLAYDMLRKSPKRLICFLCARQALSTYDASTRTAWLEERGWWIAGLDGIADKVSGLPLPNEVDTGLSVFAEAYWRRELKEAYGVARSAKS